MSNYEVYELARKHEEVRQSRATSSRKYQTSDFTELNTILLEVKAYLDVTAVGAQSPEIINKFLRATKDWAITKTERLMLLNLRPRNVLEMFSIIDEAETRFGESWMETLQAMVDTLSGILPDHPRTNGILATTDPGTGE